MGKAKTGEKPNQAARDALADLNEQELAELAKEKGLNTDGMDKEQIIEAIIEVDPTLQDDSASDDGSADSGEDNTPTAEEKPNEGLANVADVKTDDVQVGTIRQIKGVEMVNVGTAWVPTIRENVEDGKPITVISQKRAGKTIYAKTGKPITFDEKGRATVSAADGNYLVNIIIDGKPEFTAE